MRWLLIAIFCYLIYKLIQGPKRRQKANGFPFGSFGRNDSNGAGTGGRLDHIEEAEFEDITDKEKKSE